MTNYGKITHYDAIKGTGMISPENGGDALRFDRTGLQQQAQEPRSDQLYTYETHMGANGEALAVNLQMEQGGNANLQQSGDHGSFDRHGESEASINEEAARRLGVDEAGTGQGGASQQSEDRIGHQTRTDQEGVSRGGATKARPDKGMGSGGGSTFQPLEAESSKRHHSSQEQHDLGRDSQGRDERRR